MSRQWPDSNDDFADDRDAPQPADLERFGDSDDADSETVACPSCLRAIWEEAEQCPHCGEYVTRGGQLPARAAGGVWAVLGAVLAIVLTLLAIRWL